MDIAQHKRDLTQRLLLIYPPEEAAHLSKRLLEYAYGMPYPRLLLSSNKDTTKQIDPEVLMQRLLQGEPWQYIEGSVAFDGLQIHVAPGVLIPRPETEYMCHLIRYKSKSTSPHTVADLCTGSGCIALSLAHSFSRASIEAVELSHDALRIAADNIARHDMSQRITLRDQDLLSPDFIPLYDTYDIVASNPPYVLPSERASMHANVLHREPSEALFVPEERPLLFYETILHHYLPRLCTGGLFAFEINAQLSSQALSLARDVGLRAEIVLDLSQRPRYLFATR